MPPTSGPQDRNLIDNKHEVSMYYVERLSLAPQEGFDAEISAVLNRVNAQTDTVEAALELIDFAFNDPITIGGIVENTTLFESFWI